MCTCMQLGVGCSLFCWPGPAAMAQDNDTWSWSRLGHSQEQSCLWRHQQLQLHVEPDHCHVLAHMPVTDGTHPSPGRPEMVPAASYGVVPSCDAPTVRQGSLASHLPPRGLLSAWLCLCGSLPLCGICNQDSTVQEISSPL